MKLKSNCDRLACAALATLSLHCGGDIKADIQDIFSSVELRVQRVKSATRNGDCNISAERSFTDPDEVLSLSVVCPSDKSLGIGVRSGERGRLVHELQVKNAGGEGRVRLFYGPEGPAASVTLQDSQVGEADCSLANNPDCDREIGAVYDLIEKTEALANTSTTS